MTKTRKNQTKKGGGGRKETHRLPIFGVVLFRLAHFLDLLRFFELLLRRQRQFGRPRFDELHRIVGHFGRGFGRTRRDVLGRAAEVVHLCNVFNSLNHSLIDLDRTRFRFFSPHNQKQSSIMKKKYLSAAIGAARRMVVQTLARLAVSVQGTAGTRVVVARAPRADAVKVFEFATGLRLWLVVWRARQAGRTRSSRSWSRSRGKVNMADFSASATTAA